jgi:copper chaperone CopZ
MQRTALDIDGMTCDGCVRAVERKLKSLPGVRKVQVNLQGNSAEVNHEVRVTSQELAEAVGKLGYPARVK